MTPDIRYLKKMLIYYQLLKVYWLCDIPSQNITISLEDELRFLTDFCDSVIPYTLPTDQLLNLEFQFECVVQLRILISVWIQLGITIPMGVNLGECTTTLECHPKVTLVWFGVRKSCLQRVLRHWGFARFRPLFGTQQPDYIQFWSEYTGMEKVYYGRKIFSPYKPGR